MVGISYFLSIYWQSRSFPTIAMVMRIASTAKCWIGACAFQTTQFRSTKHLNKPSSRTFSPGQFIHWSLLDIRSSVLLCPFQNSKCYQQHFVNLEQWARRISCNLILSVFYHTMPGATKWCVLINWRKIFIFWRAFSHHQIIQSVHMWIFLNNKCT